MRNSVKLREGKQERKDENNNEKYLDNKSFRKDEQNGKKFKKCFIRRI